MVQSDKLEDPYKKDLDTIQTTLEDDELNNFVTFFAVF